MIYCDGCEGCWHLDCLNPPLHLIPAGSWRCPPCRHEQRHAQYQLALGTAPDRQRRREAATVLRAGLPSLDDLHTFLEFRHAEGTRTKYRRAWDRFSGFAEQVRRDTQDEKTLALFILWRLRHGLAYSTLRGEVSGVLDRAPALRGALLVGQALQAARRLALVPLKTKAPLSLEQVGQLLEAIRGDRTGRQWQLRNSRDWLFILMAYLGFFRGSELCRLTWGDLSFTWEGAGGRFESPTPTVQASRVLGVTVHIRESKTDPGAEGQFVRLAPNLGSPEWCPVNLLQKVWKRLGNPGPTTPVFANLVDGEPLATDTMRSRFKTRVAQILPDPELVSRYSLHSLRRGGATAAMAAGVPYRLVKRQGRWRSDTAQLYMWASDDELLQVSSKLLEELQ